MAESRRLERSNDAMIAGICAGLAEYFDIDVVIVRILAVALGLASFGVTIFAYILLWLIIPKRPTKVAPIDVTVDQASASQGGYYTYQQNPGNPFSSTEFYGQPINQPGQPFVNPYPYDPVTPPANTWPCSHRTPEIDADDRWCRAGVWVGVLLLIAGIAGLVSAFVNGVSWWQFWPLAFIVGGIAQVLLPSKSGTRTGRIASGIMVAALGLLLLACSTGILQWVTISHTFYRFWSLLMIVLGLLIMGGALHKGAYVIGAALIFAVFCFLGLTVSSVPGEVTSLLLDLPYCNPMTLYLPSM